MLKKQIMCLILGLTLNAGIAEQANKSISWNDYLMPMPHEIKVQGIKYMEPNKLGIQLEKDSSDMVMQAVSELRNLYKKYSGVEPSGNTSVIIIGKLDKDGHINGYPVNTESLKKAPFPEQAYTIQPIGSNKLIVAAYHERGLFYGIQTLKQLLMAKLSKSEIIVPIVSIADWPDFDERGPWNADYKYPGIIPWMASCKLNFTHIPQGITLKKDAPASCRHIPMKLIHNSAEKYAFKLIPHCPHYDFWIRYGLQKLYPDVVGKGDSARHPFALKKYEHNKWRFFRCPCASNPKFQELVTDWVRDAASQGVRELSLWLSEFSPQQCECENCTHNGQRQWITETKASIAAIQTVQKEYPNLIGRIFFTLGHTKEQEQDSRACLALIPPKGIKVEKPYGPNKPFDEYAIHHWVANYGLNMESHKNIRDQIRMFHDKKYSAVYGIGVKTQDKHEEKLLRLAEWSWNANGRDETAFNKAYATRLRLPNPEQYAEWKNIVKHLIILQTTFHRTPHSTSSIIMPQLWDETMTTIEKRQPLPKNFPKPEHLSRAITDSRKAVECGKDAGSICLEQSLFLKNYFQALQHLAALHRLEIKNTEKNLNDETQKKEIQKLIENLESSLSNLKKEATLKGMEPEKYSKRFKLFLEKVKSRISIDQEKTKNNMSK